MTLLEALARIKVTLADIAALKARADQLQASLDAELARLAPLVKHDQG